MPTLSRRDALAAFAATLTATSLTAPAALAALPPDDQALVDRAVAYLDRLTSVKARFEQGNDKGGAVEGTLWLARPGRARFEYDPPSGQLITCDGQTVVVTDSRRGTFQHVALKATPLAIFLADHIRLDKGAHVTRVARNGDSFSVTAQGARGLGGGQITLSFQLGPRDSVLRLTDWVVLDGQNRTTRVTLGPLTPVATPPASFFTQAPRPA